MTVKEFIDAINETIPSRDQIIKKFNWEIDIDQNVKRKQDEYTIRIKDENAEYDEFEFLMANTNIWELQIGQIIFEREVAVVDEIFQRFATVNDTSQICLKVLDRSIVWFDDFSEDNEEIAVSFSQFLSFMGIYNRYSKHQVWAFDFPKREFGAEIKELIENGLSESFVSTLIHDWPWK